MFTTTPLPPTPPKDRQRVGAVKAPDSTDPEIVQQPETAAVLPVEAPNSTDPEIVQRMRKILLKPVDHGDSAEAASMKEALVPRPLNRAEGGRTRARCEAYDNESDTTSEDDSGPASAATVGTDKPTSKKRKRRDTKAPQVDTRVVPASLIGKHVPETPSPPESPLQGEQAIGVVVAYVDEDNRTHMGTVESYDDTWGYSVMFDDGFDATYDEDEFRRAVQLARDTKTD